MSVVNLESSRSDRRRPRWVRAFLAALDETDGDVSKAARIVLRQRSTIYEYRDRSAWFRAEWDAVLTRVDQREVEMVPRSKAS